MIWGSIKFFVKIGIVILIAAAAVAYHNTDSGREMERRIGKVVEYDSMKARGKEFITRTVDFLSLKGMDAVRKKTGKEKKSGVKGKTGVKKAPPAAAKKVETGVKAPEENITDEDRRKMEEILENAG